MIGEYGNALREQLLEVATQRAEERQRQAQRRRVALTAAAILLITATAAGAMGVMLNSSPASAGIFVVTQDGDTIVVSVTGAIRHPEKAELELRDHGIEGTLIGVPASPSLNGELVGVSSGTGELEYESDNARVVLFRVPKSHTGEIVLEYGQEATGDELYEASEPPPECDRYSGLPLTDDLADEIASRYGPNLQWQQWGSTIETGLDRDQLARDATLIRILPISADTVLVSVTDGSPAPAGSEC